MPTEKIIFKIIGPRKTKTGGRVVVVNEFKIAVIAVVSPKDAAVDLAGNFKIHGLGRRQQHQNCDN
jgi:hypothetical protein